MSEPESDEPAAGTLARFFIAFKLAEAKMAERILDAHGIEYTVAVEPLGRSLFGSARNGAVFSVPPDRAAECKALFDAAGLGIGVIPPG